MAISNWKRVEAADARIASGGAAVLDVELEPAPSVRALRFAQG
jgi:hypothetical protein